MSSIPGLISTDLIRIIIRPTLQVWHALLTDIRCLCLQSLCMPCTIRVEEPDFVTFWDRWMTNPMFAGGFIWVFCDEALKRSDRGGVLDSDGSNAPDGVVGPRREKEGSFYAIRSQWSPVQIKPLLITEHFGWKLFRLE